MTVRLSMRVTCDCGFGVRSPELSVRVPEDQMPVKPGDQVLLCYAPGADPNVDRPIHIDLVRKGPSNDRADGRLS